MLVLEAVEKRWGAAVALAGLSLEVEAGELLAVLGPSGSGKSTALRVVAGLEEPDAGRVLVGGRDVAGSSPAERDVALVFQSFALFPHLSVAENVGFGLRARGTPGPERERRVAEAAAVLGIDALLARRPQQLSGGERQRVALARALVRRPAVLLLDEPLSNLDAPLREQAREAIRELHRETGATVVHVTHDQAEALALGQRVAVLAAGRLAQVGTPDEVYEHPADRFVAAFVGEPPMTLLPVRVVDGALRGPGPVVLPLPPGPHPDVPLVAGFRAEGATCPAPAGTGFPAELVGVERAGHERLWRLRAGDHALAVRPAPGAQARPGDTVAVAVAPGAVRLFPGDP